MRVVSVSIDGHFSGPQHVTAQVAARLAPKGVETVVVLPRHGSERFAARLAAAGIEVRRLPLHKLTRHPLHAALWMVTFLPELILLVRELRRLRPDIVHCSGVWQPKAVLAGSLSGGKVVLELNDTRKHRLLELLFRLLAPLCAGFTIAGERAARHYLTTPQLRARPHRVIQAPVDVARFDPAAVEPAAPWADDGRIHVVTVGNVNRDKGLEHFVAAAALVAAQRDDIRFHVVGPVPETQARYARAVRQQADGLPPGTFTLHGVSDDVPGVLRAADIYVCASVSEASPMAVWEAMAMGLPVVSTDVGDVARFVVDGESGYVVPVASPEHLAARILELADDLAARARLGGGARQVAAAELDLTACAEQYRAFYEQLAPARARLVLVCQHFYPEMLSTGITMTQLAVRLVELGWAVTVYTARPTLDYEDPGTEVPTELDHHGVRVVRLRTMGSHAAGMRQRLLFALTFLASATWALLRNRRDFDAALMTTNPPFVGLAGTVARALRSLPFVLIVHDVYPDALVRLGVLRPRSPITAIWELSTRIIVNTAACNVVIGRDMAELIGAKLGPSRRDRLRIIPNWYDERTAPALQGDNPFPMRNGFDGKLVVQYSGRMGHTHNIEPLVDAAALLAGDDRIVFQLIGGGAKKERLEQEVASRGLANVEILPYQPFERLSEVLSASDVSVVCLESRFTGVSVPSKTYGVMACGVPVMAFVDPGSEIGRTVTEHDCGVVLPEPTGEEVAAVIRELAADPELRRRLAANARRAYEAHFTLAAAAARYDAVLRASCAARPAR